MGLQISQRNPALFSENSSFITILVVSLVSEWGDIIDEMSDRMANQPSLIRKFAKERCVPEKTTDSIKRLAVHVLRKARVGPLGK